MTPLSPLAIELRGIQLIEASAGTGKTHTITTLFVRLLLERKVRVDQILVVTFTKAATAELRDRVRRRLGQALAAFRGEDVDPELAELARASRDRVGDVARLEESLSEFDQAAIFTIHGFCQRAIADHAFEGGLGFDLSLVTDQRALVSEAVLDFWVRELSTASPAELEQLAARRVSPRRWQRLAAEVLGAPDLVIDVIPGRPCLGEIQERLDWYFAYGVREAWVHYQLDQRLEVLQGGRDRISARCSFDYCSPIASMVWPDLTLTPGQILYP